MLKGFTSPASASLTATSANLEAQRGLRESDRPFLLCLDYKQVRGVEGARGLHIYAMPPSILVRHRHGTPTHRKSV